MLIRTLQHITLFVLAAGALLLGQEAQPRGAVRVTVGYAMQYLDEPWRPAVGGSVRLTAGRRWSVEPEVVFSPGPRFRQWTLIPNLVYDLRNPGAKTTPYIIGGAGYFSEVDKSIDYRRSEPAWSAGFGVRLRLAGGLIISPEFRLGSITRAAVGAGYQF